MKRIGGLWQRVWARENLSLAVAAAARGKRDRAGVRAFLASLDEELERMGRELREGTYAFGRYHAFPVRDTKTRTIHAPPFRDRVVHQAIILATGPVFERGAIDHSYACRTGKGQHAALLQAREWTRPGSWYGKMDVRKFYDSVPHEVIRRLLRRRFREERLLHLWDALLESYAAAEGRGIPIGALTSQYLGNFVLDDLDWRVRHAGFGKRYLRYMDDAVVWAADRDSVLGARRVMAGALEDLGLEMKHGGEWNRCAHGVPFVGFVIYPGRVRVNAMGRKRLRRRVKALERDAGRGRVAEAELAARVGSMWAHVAWGDDLEWRRTVLRFTRWRDA